MTKQDYLQNIVDAFNEDIKCWEDLTDMRANFGFKYTNDGRKYMVVLDVDTAKQAPEQTAMEKAAKIIAEASDESVQPR